MQQMRGRIGALLGAVALVAASCAGAGSTTAPTGAASLPAASAVTSQPAASVPVASATTSQPAASQPAASATTSQPAASQPAASEAAVSCPSSATQIEVQSWWTTGGESTGLQKVFDKFNAANPDLCAFNAAIAGGAGTVAQGVVKTRVLGGNPPDTFQVHMGHELLDTYVNLPSGSVLTALGTDVIDPSKFAPGVVDIIKGKDGSVYTVPMNIHRANELWYNKTVLTGAGIAAPAKSWDEFLTQAATLKSKNIAALAVGDKDIWPVGMIFESILIANLGDTGFNGLWTGATKWDDAKVTASLDTLKQVLTFINTDAASLSWDQANDLVIQGKAAYTLMGDWANGDYVAKKFTDYGWAPAPGNDGIYQALADSFPLPAKAPHQDAVKKLLTYMATAEAQDIFNPYKGSIPARTDAGNPPAGGQQYNDYQKSAIQDWKTNKVVPSMEHGAAAAPSWKSEIEAALTTFVTSGDTASTQTALVSGAQTALGQ